MKDEKKDTKQNRKLKIEGNRLTWLVDDGSKLSLELKSIESMLANTKIPEIERKKLRKSIDDRDLDMFREQFIQVFLIHAESTEPRLTNRKKAKKGVMA